MPNSKLLTLCALGIFLFSAGCDAQRPAAGTQPASGPQYVEPTLTGKIIDAETRQPINGAFVYGQYSTSTGTLAGGRKFGEAVKSFLVQTDANGEFRLEGWNSGERQIGGLAGDRFPYIGIYKPGYDMRFDRLNTIAQWRPKTDDSNAHVTVSNGEHDWRAYPYLLKPAKGESARYFALDISSAPMLMIGECGWEVYAPLLLAQHTEWLGILKRTFPAEYLTAAGRSKGTYNHPDLTLRANQTQETAVDRILQRAIEQGSGWKCMNPATVFGAKAQ